MQRKTAKHNTKRKWKEQSSTAHKM
jgi:hypothetical protein